VPFQNNESFRSFECICHLLISKNPNAIALERKLGAGWSEGENAQANMQTWRSLP
jgi:hypothetical protein